MIDTLRKMDENQVRQFYKRLNHAVYGVTELVAMDAKTGSVSAMGWFQEEDDFLKACRTYGKTCNLYAGRNPRPSGFVKRINQMLKRQKWRASDKDIHVLTAISLDIDPIRHGSRPATPGQHRTALAFALDMQWDLGGWVDDSGNGAHIWLVFETPIEVGANKSENLKARFAHWQRQLRQKYRPERYGLRIDGCYDFCRIKRITGTFNYKAKRTSRCIRQGKRSDRVRDEILATPLRVCHAIRTDGADTPNKLPEPFLKLLAQDAVVRRLWRGPQRPIDKSGQDWLLCQCCLAAGIVDRDALEAILVHRPSGKYQRDRRMDYVKTTVCNLLKKRG